MLNPEEHFRLAASNYREAETKLRAAEAEMHRALDKFTNYLASGEVPVDKVDASEVAGVTEFLPYPAAPEVPVST